MPPPQRYTVTVRSASPRGVPAGGRVWGRAPVAVEVDATTLRDLWTKRRELEVAWPWGWQDPSGGWPGGQHAPAPPPPEPTPLPEPAAVAPATAMPATAQPVEASPLALPEPVVPASAAAPADATAEPAPPALPVPVPAAPPPALLPITLVPYDPRHAGPAATLWGYLPDLLRQRGVRPVSTVGEGLTLEKLFELVPNFTPSAPQVALARAINGQPVGDVLPDERLLFHFGCSTQMRLWCTKPRVIYLRCGIRAGKTYVAALGVLVSALTCSTRRPLTPDEVAAGVEADADGLVPALRQGERARVVMVTPKASQSSQAFGYVLNAVESIEELRRLIVHKTTETLLLRRPHDGVEVLFEMVAASPRGNNIRSGWLAGALFDESAFFGDGPGAAITLTDNLAAATTRMLPGAQVWLPSSPWSDQWSWHETIEAALGHPSEDVLAFHSDSVSFNPSIDRSLIEAARRKDPLEAAREYDAKPLSSLGNAFFPPAVIAMALAVAPGRLRILPPDATLTHHAGSDLGFRRNSSALAIARARDEVVELAYMEERMPMPGAPLKPSEVCQAFGRTCLQYGAGAMRGDLHYAETARENLDRIRETDDLTARVIGAIDYTEWAPTLDNISAMYTTMRDLMAEGKLSLPDDPRLLSQIKGVLSKPIGGGKLQVHLPKQGRAHADLLVAVAQAVEDASVGARHVGTYDARWDNSGPQWDTVGL